MRAALLQICSSDDPAENLKDITARIAEAAANGAGFILTPEVTNCVSSSRARQRAVLRPEAEDETLRSVRAQAAELGVWVLLGSLGIKTDDADGRFANRSFLIGPDGDIAARYDKIHMFDVDIADGDSFRESDGYRPGDRAVVADTPFAKIGMAVCYDVRFAYLFRALAKAGAQILTVPAAFHPVTGAAHWETLLRARAIETGCYVLAPAQTGDHKVSEGAPRRTYGHSIAIAPWGEVLAVAGDKPETIYVDIDVTEVDKARARVPALHHDRAFEGPDH